MTPEVKFSTWAVCIAEDGLPYDVPLESVVEETVAHTFEAWGARLSSNLNCTEWSMFATEDDAWDFLAKVYGLSER